MKLWRLYWECDENSLQLYFPPVISLVIGKRWYNMVHNARSQGVVFWLWRRKIYEKSSFVEFYS